uniref:Xylulose kinase-1 n=1 Tax=Tanacetum cinerariifolium TaxID=118510 RepID=A0A699H5E2_TANCI|nr:hypothetical protein [Tanacetum cinerariifolium]
MAPLTFADTHNMIAFLTKSDASEGFDQIVDFLNAHMIQYALMVNPIIYVSCIKQFWISVSIKKSNDAVRLQALIDRKKVIITEDRIRQALRLDDATGIDCLPNDEIFAELARMRYEKPMVRNVDSPSKFLMYPRFLQLMNNVQVDDLSSHNTTYTSPSLTQKVFANMKRIGKGFSGVDTPLFDDMLVQQQVQAVEDVVEDKDDDNEPSQTANISMTLLNTLLETCATLTKQVGNLEQDKIAQAIKITKLKQRVRRLEKKRQFKSLGLNRLRKVGIAQRVESSVDIDTDEAEPAEVEKVIEVVTTAKSMTEVVTTAVTTITAAQVPKASAPRRRRGVVIQDPEETATASVIVYSEVKYKDKGKGILIEEPKPLKRQAQIEQDKAFARQLEAELNANINWDDVMEQVKRKEKQDNTVMRYQALKRKPITEAQARKNMMIYLKNMVGFKMDFFKGMTYNEIRPIFEKHYNSIQAFLEKGEKEIEEKGNKRKANDDDDVYTEATPLALKVPVVDYQIHHEHNKPYYKIIRANGTHQLFLSFITLLKNFDREDLEMLWKLVQKRFQSSEPKNFLDDFLLNTLDNMILLVEKKYPLTHFTLEQILNNVRLKVEEESEMSLELLRLMRRQLQEGYIPE